MNMRLTRTLAATTMTAVALAVAACGGEDSPKLDEQTLRLTKKETDLFKYVDQPPKTKLGPMGPEMFSLGDQIISGVEYVDAAGKRTGDVDGVCTVTKSGGFDKASHQCLFTVTISGGTLALSLGGPIMQETGMAVVGGTGRYEGASGSFTSKPGDGGLSHDVMHLFVPKQ